jgi:predicted aconitase with swiveling domain
MSSVYQGRSISKGLAEGEALVTKEGISFMGGVNPDTGVITEVGHELYGKKITGKILVFPNLKGSAAGMWIIIRTATKKKGPKAIIITKADTILVGGVIMAGIPSIDSLPVNPLEIFKSGDLLKVDGTEGTVEVITSSSQDY